jgi:hypothetical protein
VKRPPSLQGRHSASRPAQRNRVPRWITPDVVTISSHIIARWLGSAPFVDEAGHPRPLPRTAEAGAAGLSFDALVNSVTTDIRPPAVLEIWLSLELVRMESIDRVVLNADAFIPRPGESEQLFYFAREQAYRDLLESIRDRALRFLQMAPAMEDRREIEVIALSREVCDPGLCSIELVERGDRAIVRCHTVSESASLQSPTGAAQPSPAHHSDTAEQPLERLLLRCGIHPPRP